MSPLDCREFVEKVTSYLEGELSTAAEQDFVDHLALCDGCERYLEQMCLTTASLADLPADSISTDARSALLNAFRARRS
ncbi:zf-HC2 domain-containing protein [Kribbella turkmenica]|uniref:Zf-HC2 domain-containing protein n=1 Tax=Kribbella turkmenica TaxID=2530375 RepID=A0A4R4WVW4_9ACTN|nr:zf-HC2 domain-containing protein [Kribbella turkmenica]TDD21841.1 zf-HC2 domain-containing protein [Kribbella turkmenica]